MEASASALGKHVGQALYKRTARLVVTKILRPLLPLLAIAGFIMFLFAALTGAVYSAYSSTRTLAGAYEDETGDTAMFMEYEKLCGEYNVLDTWVVNSRAVTPDDGNAYEASPEKPFHPGRGVENLGALPDPYGNDKKLRLLWGQTHAAALFYAYANGLTEISAILQEEVTKDLHPCYYYKKSQVITVSCDDEGDCETTVYNQYLLVEAYTIQGHFQYHYQWVTNDYPGGSVTREEFRDSRQILPNKWRRLEDWIQEAYQVNDDAGDLTLARMAVWEAGYAFDEHKEWLEWLIKSNLTDAFASVSAIPPELTPLFKEAEEKYGVPWWFLAAIAYKESGFNPQTENTQTRCYGLLQFTPSNWLHYATLLGFEPDLDRDNPRAQILCGAYMLKELGLKFVEWESPSWREDTLDVLAFYGGFRGSDARQRCQMQYAEPIWRLAEEFKTPVVIWPTPGFTMITSNFGIDRGDHIHGGIDIGAPEGALVTSASAGQVTVAGQDGDYGLLVVVEDQQNAYFYAHLSRISVNLGQKLGIGTEIGRVGSTGKSTGPHLHFEVRSGGRSGRPIDPLLILSNSR